MKTVNVNAKRKKSAAKQYVEAQLDILRKHGSTVSAKKSQTIIRQVARASTGASR
jgi:hypothetical protein